MTAPRLTSGRLAWFCRILVAAAAVPGTVYGADASAEAAGKTGDFVDRVYRDEAGEHKYAVFVPAGYSPQKKWPVILFLHGAGERGTDGKKQTTVGLGPFVKAQAATFPFLVVFPQCEDQVGRRLEGWLATAPDGRRALKILDEVEKEYSVDRDREVVTGWSMGGYGTWSMAASHPKRWHAVVPLAGGGETEWAKTLKDVPIWVFHGAKDGAVRPEASRTMVDAIRDAGGKPRYSEVPEVDHDIWQVAYGTPELFEWMLNPSAFDGSEAGLAVSPGHRPSVQPADDSPFVPAVEMPNAVYVRLGNDMLSDLALSIPSTVPSDLLTGQVDDIYDYTYAEGRSFQVTFSGITYSGELAQAMAQAYDTDRLNIQLGLQNVQLTIRSTYVSGRSHSAVAGTIAVVIGHREPVWLSFDVTPYVENRKLRLKLLSADFDIPHDNWYVTSPAGVSVSGFGMTRRKVADGLVSGLYGSKSRIESEVEAIVPSLLSQIEEKLDLADTSDLVKSFWPLPVYKPRVQVWASDVSTDDQGVSVTLGVTAAAIDPAKAPERPKVVRSLGRPANDVPKTTVLQVGVAPDLLRPLTELLIQADEARIHVLDIPQPEFEVFADRKVLAQAVPDLKQYGEDVEVWTELVLAEPLTVVSDDAVSPQTFTFRLPKLLLSIALKTSDAAKQWKPYAEFILDVSHASTSEVVRPDAQTRALKLDWAGEPQIKVSGRFAPGYTPKNSHMDLDRVRKLFADGWRGWTSKGTFAQTTVPDIDFGLTKLRLSKTGWKTPYLFVDFLKPGIRITNSADVTIEYEVQGPYGGWSGPYELAPGKTHAFEVAYELLYRRQTETGVESYTLPIGSHSEFRATSPGGPPGLFQAREDVSERETGDGKSDTESSGAKATDRKQ